MEKVKELKYLRTVFNGRLKRTPQIKQAAEKTMRLINALGRSAKVNWGLRCDALKVIFDGAVVPILTYGSSVWIEGLNNKCNVRILERVQRIIASRLRV